jgi:Tol biopolymer transport system component
MKRLLLITVLAAGVLALGAQSGNDLFQKALLMERTEGNLQEAIKLYQQIVEKFAADRKLAAQALLQMGRCYETLGQAEARKAYERIAREFADQVEQAEVARTRLAALSVSQGSAAGSAMSVRKVWSMAQMFGAASPDARYLSFVDWETGDLAVHDLRTGENRRLTNNGGWNASGEFAMFSRWSPDSTQIAYDWYRGNAIELRVTSLESAKPRTLYSSGQEEALLTCDWSPDGKNILVSLEGGNKTSRLAIISVSDGAVRILGRGHWPARFSPDGRYVAHSRSPSAAVREQDIYLFSIADGSETPLVEKCFPGWVLFISDRAGTDGMWAVRMGDGKVQGKAQLIRSDVPDIDAMGMTRGGAFYYSYTPIGRDVYVAGIDPGTGKITDTPEKVLQRFEGISSYPAYSRDGNYLAYVFAEASRGMSGGRANIIRIRSLENGSDREFPTEFARVSTLRWLPDGRGILFAGRSADGTGIYKLDTRTGQVTMLLHDAPGVSLADMDTSADGKAFFYVRGEKGKDLCRIILRDLESGDEKELCRSPASEDFRISRSADGRWLAFLNRAGNRVLSIIPADGGEPRELFRFKQGGNFQISPAWTADSKYILFWRMPDQSKGDSDLWRMPVDGGAAEKTGLGKRYESISAHPDGRRIAFWFNDVSISEVWVMANFLPK